LRLAVETTEAEGRTLLLGSTSDRVPSGEAFAHRVGAELGIAVHTNRLVLAELDRDLVRRWVAAGPRRAPDYALVWIDSPIPEDLLGAVTDVMDVMNTAPRDDLQMEDRHLTPEQVRQWERLQVAEGTERWMLFARHEPSGELVGYTEVMWNPSQPKTIGQGDTGVQPSHRGHALGKWLKAQMLERIFAERPQAEDIRTGNADSNDAMLGINRALGFRPYIAQSAWQIPVERARAYVDGSSS
jgi:RimJ/RimL family protein N-acetyltransferase